MVIVTLIIVILLAAALWLLFTPLILYINTEEDLYYFKLPGVFSIRLLPKNGTLILLIRILFYKKEIDLKKAFFSPKKKKPKKKKVVKKKKKEKKKKSPEQYRQFLSIVRIFVIDLLRSFTVKELYLSMDTGNYMLNGLMIPMLSYVKHENVLLQVNFDGENEFRTYIYNRLIKILKLTVKLFWDLKFKIKFF